MGGCKSEHQGQFISDDLANKLIKIYRQSLFFFYYGLDIVYQVPSNRWRWVGARVNTKDSSSPMTLSIVMEDDMMANDTMCAMPRLDIDCRQPGQR